MPSDAVLRAERRSAPLARPNEPPRSAPRVPANGPDIESLVGRYGTLASGAFVILLGVGTLVVWAVQRRLLTPELRVALGALATVCVAVAGLYFRRRQELRYGNVLLALSLAMADVVAWGAGPRLHLVPTGVALAIVDLASLALAALAIRDESEFLFGIAFAGALSAPFVTSDQPGQAIVLLAYGAVVELGALRAAREPTWTRSAVLLVVGAALYAIVAASLPADEGLLGPYAIPLFAGVLALGALLTAQPEWRGVLARSFLAVGLLGVLIGWDVVPTRPLALSIGIAAALASVTYAALWVDEPTQPLWTASALGLPWLSLGVMLSATPSVRNYTLAVGAWGLASMGMWRAERLRGGDARGGVHFAAGAAFGALAVMNQLHQHSTATVAGLSTLGVLLALLARDERSRWPAAGTGVVLVMAAALAVGLLARRPAYLYVPFGTRASVAAALVTAALAGASWLLAGGRGAGAIIVSRGLRAGLPIGFALLWWRFELAGAFSRDAATFLLTLYYAAVGVAAIGIGRRLGAAMPRIAGLSLALYAAAKAVVEASEISGLSLRVGCYVAVGVFLLGAGFMYRDASWRQMAAAE